MTHTLLSGGPILWLIIILGIVSLSVYLERALQLHRDRIDTTDFLQGIFNSMRRGNFSEALTLCEETPGPVARLAATAIRRKDSPHDELVKELDQAGRAELSRMERRLSVIALVSQTAPLFGLLGTVLGILKAIVAYRENLPLVEMHDVTDGLVLGAVTTAAGLAVAIPSHLGFNLLVVKIDRLALDMRDACSEALHFLDDLTAHPAKELNIDQKMEERDA